jgi:DNA-binding CsgD family transcriptional regulator
MTEKPAEAKPTEAADIPRLPVAVGLASIVGLQLACALFFAWEVAASMLGVRREPLSWQVRELLEVGAAAGLLVGVVFGAALVARVLRRNRLVEGQLRQLSGAFVELLQERFREWGLTPSERDVAWFTIKGLSIAEIATLRSTSEGTVKAQSNAIYRKAGVSSRSQLLSLFIDDLLEGEPKMRPAEQKPADQDALST